MKKLFVCFLFLTSFNAFSATNNFGFKEYILGKTKNELSESIKTWSCKNTDSEFELCGATGDKITETIAGQKITFIANKFKNSELIEVYIKTNSSNYEEVKSAFTSKYGKPSEIKEDVLQNAYGAKFNSEQTRWNVENYMITVKQRSGKIDDTSILYSSNNAILETIKKSKQDSIKNAKDL